MDGNKDDAVPVVRALHVDGLHHFGGDEKTWAWLMEFSVGGVATCHVDEAGHKGTPKPVRAVLTVAKEKGCLYALIETDGGGARIAGMGES